MKNIVLVLAMGLFVLVYQLHLLSAETFALKYSTYLGGSGSDTAKDIILDTSGSLYITGETASNNFPTADPYQGSNAYQAGGREEDVFVSKLSSSGDQLLFSTFLGGYSYDSGDAVAVDNARCVFITGSTWSFDFPTLSAYQPSHAGIDDSSYSDAFVCKLSSHGSILIYSTYLGGSRNDQGTAIALDTAGGACVTGGTDSESFPTINPYQSSYAGWYGSERYGRGDAFVTGVSADGSSLIFSTYLGGSHADSGSAVKLHPDGSLYVAGNTSSVDFPTRNAYQAAKATGEYDEFDAFLAQISADGSSLVSSTFFGGKGSDGASCVVLDDDGPFYISGSTSSSDFPTLNPYQKELAGSSDSFVSKFASATDLSFSTYLGGSDQDYGSGIAIGPSGAVHVSGATQSLDFPVLSPFQGTFGGGIYDAFVSALSSRGSSLVYSSYLGGNGDDWCAGIAIDSVGPEICVAGWTASTDFPLRNPYQPVNAGSSDAFIGILNPEPYVVLEKGDYNGDGTSDIAIFRQTSGLWGVRGLTRAYFGSSDDWPVCGDYDGDGTTDMASFRPSSSLWAVRDVTRIYFGVSSDALVPGDYDGNGTIDVGVFRASSGLWSIRNVTRAYFGIGGDLPIPGDFRVVGKTDLGIFRGNSGLWAVRDATSFYFGTSSDLPVSGDYNGDGIWEAAVFDPSASLWSIRNLTGAYFGAGFDAPVHADFDGDGKEDMGIFRETPGLWSVRNLTRVYFGATGDIPVTR